MRCVDSIKIILYFLGRQAHLKDFGKRLSK